MVTFAAPTEAGPRLPAGEYIMVLKDIEEAEASTFNPDTQRLKFILTVQSVEAIDEYPADVDDEDDDAMEVFDQSLIDKDHWEWCNNKMGGNSTLRKWLTGMLGRTIEKTDSLDPSQFIGKPYKVMLGLENYVIQQTGQAGEKFTIKTIKPYKAPRQRKPKSNEENLAPWEREDDDE
jgi:hypothetical protein